MTRQEKHPSVSDLLARTRNPAMAAIYTALLKAARTDMEILLLGPTGSGKSHLARAIHESSGRRGRFVAVRCAGMPEQFAEDELFGHVRGAFTDARVDREGAILRARGGTLLLDEIGDLPLSVQGKLLHVLETKTFRAVGADEDLHSDFRLVAATNRNLRRGVQEGHFREDLLHRLGMNRHTLLPLAQRPEDLPALAEGFLREACTKYSLEVHGLAPACMEALRKHAWKGNIRELKRVIEAGAVQRGKGELRREDMAPLLAPDAAGPLLAPLAEEAAPGVALPPLDDFIETVRRLYLVRLLPQMGRSPTRGACIAGKSAKQLRRLLESYGLWPPAEDGGPGGTDPSREGQG